jgi:23S rRNA (pseudouridine1915-N3)-methyltransferase
MRLLIIAIGRARAGPESVMFKHYCERINAWTVTLIEKELRKKTDINKIATAESELLMKAIPEGAFIVALDEHGKELPSRKFTQLLNELSTLGNREIVFIIGGANGLSPLILERADRVISLGRMTWPHMLVRVLLIEQIYRAQQIKIGHPYHRD